MYPSQYQSGEMLGGATTPRNNRRKTLLIVVIVLVILVVIIAVVSSLGFGNSSKANSFIAAVADGDTKKSYAMLSSEALLTANEQSWAEFVELNKESFRGDKSLAYTEKLKDVAATEYGYNIGEPGKIVRVTIVVLDNPAAGGSIYSAKANKTLL